MSIRRKAGDILWKVAGYGFTGRGFKIKIPTLKDFHDHGFSYQKVEEDYDQCMMGCNDPECREYANVLALKYDGSEDGWVYHVSECQLEEVK